MAHAFLEPEPDSSVLTVPRGPHTVDDLIELPYENDDSYEVLGGWLTLSRTADAEHQLASFEIAVLLRALLPRRRWPSRRWQWRFRTRTGRFRT